MPVEEDGVLLLTKQMFELRQTIPILKQMTLLTGIYITLPRNFFIGRSRHYNICGNRPLSCSATKC